MSRERLFKVTRERRDGGVVVAASGEIDMIVGQNRRAREEGLRFSVAVEGAEGVRRILELSGLLDVLHVVGSPDDALAG